MSMLIGSVTELLDKLPMMELAGGSGVTPFGSTALAKVSLTIELSYMVPIACPNWSVIEIEILVLAVVLR